MRIRIDIDISAAELTAWLESLAAPVSTTPESTEIDRLRAEIARLEGDDDEWPDWPEDIDFDLPDEAEDSLATESRALDGLINWARNRTKGGGHA